MACAVFVDLYGVLVDSRFMALHYGRRMAEILSRQFGGPVDRWQTVHDEAFKWYTLEGAALDAIPGERREGDAWVEAANGLEARWVEHVFALAGLPAPPKPSQFARELEEEIVRGIDGLYPDVRRALRALKAGGHRLFLSTNAFRSNGESALVGGGVRELFDGVVVLEVARAKKDRPYYWQRAFAVAGCDPSGAVCVDDVARFLEPAASLGARCIQIIRPDRAGEARGPFPVIYSLATLPGLLNGQGRTRSKRR